MTSSTRACATELPSALLASYLGGQASISDSFNRASFDARLAAPKAEARVLDAARAEYIGVRANRRGGKGADQPEWDVLILPTAGDAERAATAIASENATADQDGIFVRVTKRAGQGDRARTGEAALTRCLNRSRRLARLWMPPWPRKPSFRAVAAVRSYSRAPE